MPQEEMLIAIKEIRKLLHLDSKNKMASRGEILDEETKKFAEKLGLFELPRHWGVRTDESIKHEYAFMPIEG